MTFTPTSPGQVGGLLRPSDPLMSGACPECPWRKEMTPGFSIASPNDKSMMVVAKTRHAPAMDFTKSIEFLTEEPCAQSCHMRLGNRCRGAEIFRANIGLDSEAEPNEKFMGSEDEAFHIWFRRMGIDLREKIYWHDAPDAKLKYLDTK